MTHSNCTAVQQAKHAASTGQQHSVLGHSHADNLSAVLLPLQIQGLAVGGEFGSAIVYLYEMAPKHRKGTIASLGQAAIAPGVSRVNKCQGQ